MTIGTFTSAGDLLAAGRILVRAKAPYFNAALYNLTPREVPGCGTIFVTKGMVLGYDPKWVLTHTPAKVAGLLAHEINHVLRKTWERCIGVDHQISNTASDLGINSNLIQTGWELPVPGQYPKDWGFPEGQTHEEYVSLIMQSDKVKKVPAAGSCANGKCGGIAGNPTDQSVEDALDKAFGKSSADQERIRRRVARDINAAAQNGRYRGNIAGDLLEWARVELEPPMVPWNMVLRAQFQQLLGRVQAGNRDFSLSRPNIRSFARRDGILRPGLISYEPEVAFVMDTSGSMHVDMCKAGLNECYHAMRVIGVEDVWYLEADYDVQKVERLRARNLLDVHLAGRGGTSFIPAIEHLEKLQPRPQIVVYFTDGEGSAPAEAPNGMFFVWCLMPGYKRPPADWGVSVFMGEDLAA